VLTELDNLSTQGEIDEIGREQIVDSVARAALLGARGNSGVILSQLIRGAAEELISRPGELVDPVLVAAAMARAADRAYGSVRDPAEGTILTVVREMAARAASEIAHMAEPRLQHRVQGERHVDPRVAVGDREHVEVVDLFPARLQLRQSGLDDEAESEETRVGQRCPAAACYAFVTLPALRQRVQT
jgi:hypothetical protein